MAILNFSKVVSALPGVLTANTAYFVRVGTGFRLFLTNQSGTIVAYSNDLIASGDIADGAVSLAKIQDISSGVILGRVTGGSGDTEQLTATQVRSLLFPSSGLKQGGRLGLSASPFTNTDITAGTSLYLEPYETGVRWVHDGTTWIPYLLSPASISLSGLSANTNYEVWHHVVAGALTIGFVAWTNDTTRASALKWKDGTLVNNASITTTAGNVVSAERAVYLGGIRTVAAGQCDDTISKRFCSNALNREEKVMYRASSGNVSYTSTTIRPWNNDGTTNSIHWLDSMGTTPTSFTLEGSVTTPATGTAWAFLGMSYATNNIADGLGFGLNNNIQTDKTMILSGADTFGHRQLYINQGATGSATTFYYYELTARMRT
jgi:hypothetical protein